MSKTKGLKKGKISRRCSDRKQRQEGKGYDETRRAELSGGPGCFVGGRVHELDCTMQAASFKLQSKQESKTRTLQ